MRLLKISTIFTLMSLACKCYGQQSDSALKEIKHLHVTNVDSSNKILFNSILPIKDFHIIVEKPQLKVKSFLPAIYETKAELKNIKDIISHPVSIGNVSAEYESEPFYYPFDSSRYYFSNRGNFRADLTFGGVPINIDYTHLHFSDNFLGESINRFSFRFDKDAYLDQVKNKLKVIFNEKQALDALRANALEVAKNKALQNLKNEIDIIKKTYKGTLDNTLSKLGNLKTVFNNDIATSTNQILNPDLLKSVRQCESLLLQLQQKINLGKRVDKKITDSVKNVLNAFKGLQEVVKKISEHKKQWASNLISENIKNSQLLKKVKVNQIINDPSNIKKLAAARLNLSGLQKLLLNAERLDIGQNTLSISPLSIQNFISTGINGEFFNKNKYLLVTASQQPALNSVWDYPFSNNIINNSNRVFGVRMGTGNISSDKYTHLSMFTYRGTNIQPGLMGQQPQRSTIVATLSNKINIGERGSLSAEISHSAMQYSNERNPLDSSNVNKTALGNLFSTENFGKSIAFTVNYADEYPSIGLTQQIEIKSVSNGYYNPGNTFMPTGTKEIDFNSRKYFLRRQLQIGVRGNIRQYQYNDAIDKKWRNSNYTFDIRWKFKKGQFIGLRYQPIAMHRIEDKVKTGINESKRLTVEGNINKKIKRGIYYRNYLNLSFQQNQYLIGNLQNSNNSSFLVTSQQNILIKEKLIFWNTSYNKVNNQTSYFFFNTSLNSDLGYTYQLLKGLSASTSAGYRSMNKWYTQIAIRQTLAGQLGKKLSINIYVDAGKNLKVFQPLPFSALRIEWSLKYLFKN